METQTEGDVVVSYRGKEVRLVPWGGRIEALMRGNRFYEAEMLGYIETLGLRGTYVDVGAYVGTHTLFFATHCPAERVHAFEPRAREYGLLAENVARNQLAGRVVTHNKGLSDRAESITVHLDKRDWQIECDKLDALIDEPVSVMKIDVEGMESRVLDGADRLIAKHRPLIFVEAHSLEELERDAAVLAKHGYRITGRAFNAAPTYELAPVESPFAPISRLPVVEPLIRPELWRSSKVDVSVTGDRLRVVSKLAAGQRGFVSQDKVELTEPPKRPLTTVTPGATYFLEANGQASEGFDLAFLIDKYARGKPVSQIKQWLRPRMFHRLDIEPGVDQLRITIRPTGPGEVTLDRLALHVAHPPAVR
jgi:FkbM family methyltransferase